MKELIDTVFSVNFASFYLVFMVAAFTHAFTKLKTHKFKFLNEGFWCGIAMFPVIYETFSFMLLNGKPIRFSFCVVISGWFTDSVGKKVFRRIKKTVDNIPE